MTASDTLLLYRFVVPEATEIALFASASTAPLALSLSDSASGEVITGIYLEAGRQLLQRRTLIVPVTGAKTYLISVRPQAQPVAQDFRFLIYRVNRAPENHGTALTLEEAVTNETLETSADIDEFTVQGPAGQELIGFLQALDPSLEGVALLTVALPSPPFSVHAGAGDPEAATTGRFVLPSAETVRVTLQADSPTWMPGSTQSGLARFVFRAIDRRPEQGGAAVAVGDTIDGGSIDFVGDIDEYTVSATPGSELNVFLQAVNDTAENLLTLRVTQTTGVQPYVQSAGTDSALTRQATGRFSVPPEGRVTLEVAGASDFGGLHRGAYRFFVYSINRSPEIVSAALTLGQPVVGETIELPGDIDEFVLTAPAASLANLVLAAPAAGASLIRLDLTDRSSGAHLVDLPLFEPVGPGNAEVARGAGTFTLQPGSYTLQVQGQNSTGDAYRGSYGVETWALDSLPESVPQTLDVAAGPVSEALTPLGDRDIFSFTGSAGDLLDLTLVATAADEAPGFQAFIQPVTINGPFAGALASGRNGPPGRSGRFELPASGTYRIVVLPINDGRRASETGPYSIDLLPYPAEPEHTAAAVQLGQVVTGEDIGQRGDVDDFLLSATPGSEVQVFLKKDQINSGQIRIRVFDAATGNVLRTLGSAGFEQAVGRIPVPAGGSLRIRFDEARFPGCYDEACAFHVVDGYRFSSVLIDRAPEVASGTLQLGVTVEGEAMDPVGDVDEFTFTGAAGQQVRGYLQSVTGFPGGGARLEILPGSGNTVLGSVEVTNPDGNIRTFGTGGVVLPSAGTYRVRVQGIRDTGGSGPYRILVE